MTKEILSYNLNMLKGPFSKILKYLCSEIKRLKVSPMEKNYLIAARKNKEKYAKIKKAVRRNKDGTCSPNQILHAIEKVVKEEGKENEKDLPLDRNYKYPIKTSKSIWTVRKK